LFSTVIAGYIDAFYLTELLLAIFVKKSPFHQFYQSFVLDIFCMSKTILRTAGGHMVATACVVIIVK